MKKRRSRREKEKGAQGVSRDPGDRAGLIRNWVVGAILVATFAVFANSIGNGFAYDDRTQILQNQVIRSFSNIGTAVTKEVWFWRALQYEDPGKQDKPTTPYYRPMFTIFQMVCWALFPARVEGSSVDQNAGWWHLTSILAHLLAVYVVFLMLEKVTRDWRLSAIATLLFAIHPLRSESVAWISGVTDPLLTVFLVSSFYFYVEYRESGRLSALMKSLSLFLLAAFTKEPAVALTVFIGAYELFVAKREARLSERLKPAVVFSAVFFAISIVYFAMRYYALGFVLNDIKYTNYSFLSVLMTIPIVIWKYLGLLVLPVNLSLFHGTPIVKSPLDVRFIVPFLALILLVLALMPIRKSHPGRFALLWFGIHLLPVLNLSAFGEDFMVQERYVYIPSIGFSLLVALALTRIPIDQWLTLGSRRLAQGAILALVATLLAGKSFAQNPVWQNDDDLWTHGAEVAPDQAMPYFILGHHYIKRQKIAEAIDALEKYTAMAPGNLVVITNLASAHLLRYESQVASKLAPDRAHVDRAIALCEQGLNMNNRDAALWDTLGRAYTYDTELKNFARARSCFTQAIRIEPNLMVANLHLGFTYLKEGDYDTAIRYLEVAKGQQPDFADTYKFMGHAYAGKEKFQEAIDNIGLYLTLQPEALDAGKERQFMEGLTARLKAAAQKS